MPPPPPRDFLPPGEAGGSFHQRRSQRGERKAGPRFARAPPAALPAAHPRTRKWFLPPPPARRSGAPAARRRACAAAVPAAHVLLRRAAGPWPRCSAPLGACGLCARASGPCCPRVRPAPPSGEAPGGGGAGGAGPEAASGAWGRGGRPRQRLEAVREPGRRHPRAEWERVVRLLTGG